MLYVLGKVEKDSVVVGYRVLDVNLQTALPAPADGIINAIVKTLDLYQILQILYSREGQRFYSFINAKLGYRVSPDRTYYLCQQPDGSAVKWVYTDKATGKMDTKVIPNFSSLDIKNLVLDGIECSMDAYGVYGTNDTPYVIIAEYVGANNVTMGYLVGDANTESFQPHMLEVYTPARLIERVKIRERHTQKNGLANAFMRNSQAGDIIVAKAKLNKEDSFFTVRIGVSQQQVNAQQRKPVQPNAQAQQEMLRRQQAAAQQEALRKQQAQRAAQQQQAQGQKQPTQPRVATPNAPTVRQQTQPNRLNNMSGQTVGITIAMPVELTELVAGQMRNQEVGTLQLHAGVKNVHYDALLACPNFAAFEVDKANPHLYAPGGMLLSKDGSTLIRLPVNSKLNIANIPPYIRVISEGAFRGCKGLTMINIPNTVSVIKQGAFCGCPNLKKVICCAKTIEHDAFVDCPELQEIILGYGVTTIKGTLARNSPKLNYIVLPDSLSAITPMPYVAMQVAGYAERSETHKLLENTGVKYVFAPNNKVALTWVGNLFTDATMYDKSNGQKFVFCPNSLDYLAKHNLSGLEKYIRKPA